MKIIRIILGTFILFMNALFKPKPIQRDHQLQEKINMETKNLSLYQFEACPFCVKVRRAITRLNLNIELRDAKTDQYKDELITGGGKKTVPCLRIENESEVIWMYESSDIIAYLDKRFGN